MSLAWIRIGFAAVLVFVTDSSSWAQLHKEETALGRKGEALSVCLQKHTRRLANGKTPTQADGDAAASMCTPEENALRKALLAMPGLKNGVISSGVFSGISVDLVVLCMRQHEIWTQVGFDERHRRDESVPLYRVDPRCR